MRQRLWGAGQGEGVATAFDHEPWMVRAERNLRVALFNSLISQIRKIRSVEFKRLPEVE